MNNSLWVAGYYQDTTYLYSYSLGGTLLDTIDTTAHHVEGGGLAYDPSDNTLWVNDGTVNYRQWATDGSDAFISSYTANASTQNNNAYAIEFAYSFDSPSVPEPSTYALGLIGLASLGFVAWRKRRAGG